MGNNETAGKINMENLILTDPMVNPDDAVLEETLGKVYKMYQEFTAKINEQKLVLEWNYYKDEKSWLCKVLNKKKNICWLSIWNTGFKLTFYFTEKTIEGVYKLDINTEIKESAKTMKPVGKLRPLLILITNNKIMNDGLKIIEYKIA